MALTTAEIQAAAQALADRHGKRPSLQAVRDELGSGSFSTIGGALKDWAPARTTTTTSVPDIVESISIQVAQQMASRIWEHAKSAADAATETAKNALEAKEKENKELLEILDRMLESEKLLKEHIIQEKKENEELKNEIETLRIKSAEEKGKIMALEKAIRDLKPSVTRKAKPIKEEQK